MKWLAFIVCGWLATLAGCASEPAPIRRTFALRVLAHAAGDDAKLDHRGAMLITSREQLDAAGAGDLPRMSVDFSRCSLLVLAAGEVPTAGWRVQITAVQRTGDLSTIYVQGILRPPFPDEATAQVISHPFAAIVIPRQEGVKFVRGEIDADGGEME